MTVSVKEVRKQGRNNHWEKKMHLPQKMKRIMAHLAGCMETNLKKTTHIEDR